MKHSRVQPCKWAGLNWEGKFSVKPIGISLSWWHKGDISVWVVANPSNSNPVQIGTLVPLPIQPQIGCPKYNTNSPCQEKVDCVVKKKTLFVSDSYQLLTTVRWLTNDAILHCEVCQPPHRPLCFQQTQLASGDETPQRPSNFQPPMEGQCDPKISCNDIAIKLLRFTSKVRIFPPRLYPQSANRRIRQCPNFGHFYHVSSSFHHQRKASLIRSNSSNRLPSTLLSAFSISQRSRSNSRAFLRRSRSQRFNASLVSGYSAIGISFPSTTIVPTILGFFLRLRVVLFRLLWADFVLPSNQATLRNTRWR